MDNVRYFITLPRCTVTVIEWSACVWVYQKLGMGDVKWHMLDHVADNIFRNGGLYLCDAGTWKYYRTIFKQMYAKTSKQTTYAMDDSNAIVDRRLDKETDNSLCKKRTKLKAMIMTMNGWLFYGKKRSKKILGVQEEPILLSRMNISNVHLT